MDPELEGLYRRHSLEEKRSQAAASADNNPGVIYQSELRRNPRHSLRVVRNLSDDSRVRRYSLEEYRVVKPPLRVSPLCSPSRFSQPLQQPPVRPVQQVQPFYRFESVPIVSQPVMQPVNMECLAQPVEYVEEMFDAHMDYTSIDPQQAVVPDSPEQIQEIEEEPVDTRNSSNPSRVVYIPVEMQHDSIQMMPIQSSQMLPTLQQVPMMQPVQMSQPSVQGHSELPQTTQMRPRMQKYQRAQTMPTYSSREGRLMVQQVPMQPLQFVQFCQPSVDSNEVQFIGERVSSVGKRIEGGPKGGSHIASGIEGQNCMPRIRSYSAGQSFDKNNNTEMPSLCHGNSTINASSPNEQGISASNQSNQASSIRSPDKVEEISGSRPGYTGNDASSDATGTLPDKTSGNYDYLQEPYVGVRRLKPQKKECLPEKSNSSNTTKPSQDGLDDFVPVRRLDRRGRCLELNYSDKRTDTIKNSCADKTSLPSDHNNDASDSGREEKESAPVGCFTDGTKSVGKENPVKRSRKISFCPMTAYNMCGSSAVAIDNKIEQAMDLVKSHLMFAVREEVEVLKEQIADLIERNNQLEYENGILRAAASKETLSKLAQPRQPPPATST